MLVGCGASLPQPPTGPHRSEDYVEVPYPPPAAVGEIVPEQPSASAVWVDGQWNWRGRYYVWHRGGWVVPWKDAYFAPWSRHYDEDGTLFFAEGTWRSADGSRRLPAPRVIRPASTPQNEESPENAVAP